jgi:hypothetical protein
MRPAVALLLGCLAHSAGETETLLGKLRTRRISVDFRKVPLETFLQYIRTATGVNVVLKRNVVAKQIDLEAVEITLKVQDLPAADALTLALEPLDLAFRAERNVLYVTTKRDSWGKPLLVLYSVADLLAPVVDFPAPDIGIMDPEEELPEPEVHRAVESVEELAERIRRFTGGGTWEDSEVRLTPLEDKLFIRQFPHVHREIRDLLAALRTLR